MLTLALATLRTRATAYAGLFLALVLGTAAVAMMILALNAATATRFPGPQRFAQAPAVVTGPVTLQLAEDDGDPREFPLSRPHPLSPAQLAALATTGRTLLDRAFPVSLAEDRAERAGHPWSAAGLAPYRLVAGTAPAGARDVVVGGGDPALVGRTLRAGTPRGPQEFRVSGVTAPVWFEEAVFFADDTAALLSPRVSAVIAYGPLEKVRAAVAGTSARVLTGDDRLLAEPAQDGGRDGLRDAEGMAGTTLMIIVFVVVFVVVATFAFAVDQRRRELALLRTVGATPGQIRRTVLAEALLLGCVAAALGCLAGAHGAGLLRDWMVAHDIAPAWYTVSVSAGPLVIAFTVGVVAALAGTAVAAWRAGRVRPAEAMREADGGRRALAPVRLAAGAALLGFGLVKGTGAAPDTALSMQNYLPVPVLVVGGCALLAPLLVRPVVGALTLSFRGFGAGATIVGGSALFAARRTASVAAPVVLAVGLGCALLTAQESAGEAGAAGLRAQTRADLVVLAEPGATLPDGLAAQARRVPGVAEVIALAPAELRLSGPNGHYLGTLSAWSQDGPAAGALTLDTATAGEFGLAPGDPVRAWLPDGAPEDLTVTALTPQTVAGETGTLPRIPGLAPTRLDLTLTPDADPAAVIAALPAHAVTADVYLATVRAEQQRETRLATRVVFGLAFGYTLIALANTLLMAAPGRRREHRALSLAGATRSGVLRYTLAETGLATAAGAFVGLAAALLVTVLHHRTLGALADGLPLTLPWTTAAVITLTCGAVGLTATAAFTRR